MILIPMAGKSSRFYKAGYTTPKYKLPIGTNSNVFREAVRSFEKYFKTDLFIFVNRADDDSFDFIGKECAFLGVEQFKIVTVDYDTKGQADTVKIGLDALATSLLNEELYIFNIDSIRVNFNKPSAEFLKNVSGYLEVFQAEGEHWSFIEAGENNTVVRTTEKNRISDMCSNGLYYFNTATTFLNAYDNLLINNTYPEFFIAPMYNYLLANGMRVKYQLLENHQTLFSGTPSEYEELAKNYK